MVKTCNGWNPQPSPKAARRMDAVQRLNGSGVRLIKILLKIVMETQANRHDSKTSSAIELPKFSYLDV